MKRSNVPVWIAVALLAAVGVWFFYSFERVTERELVGLRGEAARNPYLAAERLFTRMGLAARTLGTRPDPAQLARAQVMLLPAGRDAWAPEDIDALVDWAHAGGHLIVQAERAGRRDTLAQRFQLGRHRIDGSGPAKPAELTLPGSQKALKADVGGFMRLAPGKAIPPVYESAPDGRAALVSYRHGEGRITFVADFAWLRTPQHLARGHIGALDHAELAWQLVNLQPGVREVAFLGRPQTPSLWKWLQEHALWVMLAAALALAAWIWRVAPRFGPLAPDPEPERRRLLDHLRAAGRFHWSADGSRRLMAQAAESCLRLLGQRHPGIVGLPPAQRAEEFAKLTGIDATRIEHALTPGRIDSIAFTEAMSTLQQLQERLLRKV